MVASTSPPPRTPRVHIPPSRNTFTGPPLLLDMRCEACDHRWTAKVAQAFIDPRVLMDRDDPRDGVLLSQVIRCPACGAEDGYALEEGAVSDLMVQSLMVMGGEEGSRVANGVAQMWDGSVVWRASHGIARLRAWCEREPENGEAWRRLGNFLERFEEESEAMEAWRHAVEVDETEAEAAYSLAHAGAEALDWVAFEHWLQTFLGRLCGRRGPARSFCAAGAAQLLELASRPGSPPRALEAAWAAGGMSSDQPVVKLSSISLTAIRDWDAVERFLARAELFGLQLTPELPEDDTDTLLAHEFGLFDVPGPRTQRGKTARSRAQRKKARKRASASRKRNR